MPTMTIHKPKAEPVEALACEICGKPTTVKGEREPGCPVYHSACAKAAGLDSGPQELWK